MGSNKYMKMDRIHDICYLKVLFLPDSYRKWLLSIFGKKASNFAFLAEFLNAKPIEIISTDYKWHTVLIEAGLGVKVKAYCEFNKTCVRQLAAPKRKKNLLLGSVC